MTQKKHKKAWSGKHGAYIKTKGYSEQNILGIHIPSLTTLGSDCPFIGYGMYSCCRHPK